MGISDDEGAFYDRGNKQILVKFRWKLKKNYWNRKWNSIKQILISYNNQKNIWITLKMAQSLLILTEKLDFKRPEA